MMLAASYKVHDLGIPTRYLTSSATSINNKGQLIGRYSLGAETDNDGHHCFLWDAVALREITDFAGGGMNDLGQMIGQCLEDNQNLSQSVTETDLGTLADPEAIFEAGFMADIRQNYFNQVYAYSYRNQKKPRLPVVENICLSSPEAINNHGQIAGVIYTDYPLRGTACTWIGNKVERLAPSEGFLSSKASAINDHGQIVGEQKRLIESELLSEAVLWEEGKAIRIGNPDGCLASAATAINNSGQILVYGFDTIEQTVTNRRAFVWTQGQMEELDVLRQGKETLISANSLNDAGQIVGNSMITRDRSHACLWQQDSLFDLNNLIAKNSGWELISAQSINNQGQIACNGIYRDCMHAVLLMPEPS